MKRLWTNDDLLAQWTLQPNELALLEYKEGANRLGFALLLKYFQIDGRFPRQKHDVPIPAIAFVARELDVSIDLYPAYDWDGRTIKQHRADIRAFLGVRESTLQDYDEMIACLIAHHVPNDHQIEHLKAKVYARFRELQIEPPTPDRVERLVRSALRTYEQQFCAAIHAQLSADTLIQMEALLSTVTLAEHHDEPSADGSFVRSAFQELKLDPGSLSLESILSEVGKLTRIRQLSIPPTLFADVPPKIVQHYRQRAAAEVTRAMRRHPEPIRATLLAAYCVLRAQEITDQLVELLIDIVHRIGAKAQRKVEKAFLADLKRVSGKTNLLFQLAEAAVEYPDGVVKEVLYPVVSERCCGSSSKSTNRAARSTANTSTRSCGPPTAATIGAWCRPCYGHSPSALTTTSTARSSAHSICSNSTPTVIARPCIMSRPTTCRSRASCARFGEMLSSRLRTRATSGLTASTTRLRFCNSCASGSAAKKSGSKAPRNLAILTAISPKISEHNERRIMRHWLCLRTNKPLLTLSARRWRTHS